MADTPRQIADRYPDSLAELDTAPVADAAWLQGRERARHAQGDNFNLRRWHMSALSMGSLGLDDPVDALATAGASA